MTFSGTFNDIPVGCRVRAALDSGLVCRIRAAGRAAHTGMREWQFAQLEAIHPARPGRAGLKPGQVASNFTMAKNTTGAISLQDFAGRPVLLVLVQTRCEPCHEI